MATTVLNWHENPPETCRRGVVSVGNFDGVHLGHAALLRETIALAKSMNAPAIAVTFDPHPLCLLDPDRYMLPLTTIEERVEQLHRIGTDHVVVLRTSTELLNLSPDAFFKHVLCDQLQPRGIVEGFNFRFGKDRAGSNELLSQLCSDAKIGFREIAPFAARLRSRIEQQGKRCPGIGLHRRGDSATQSPLPHSWNGGSRRLSGTFPWLPDRQSRGSGNALAKGRRVCRDRSRGR